LSVAPKALGANAADAALDKRGGKYMLRKRLLLSTVAAGLLSQAAPAAAQQVEEVIVTARKRQESILNVPVVQTVLTQETLQQAATDDLFSLKSYVPGLLMGTSTNSVGTQVSLRGVGTTAQNATMDQSVSLNIDGLALSQGVAYQAGMFDVGQVEILKGPQALFYGKNSPGGVISLRSIDPTDEVEVIAIGGYEFEAREKTGQLILSGPLSDALKARLAVKYSDSDGYFKNGGVALPGFGTRNPPNKRLAPSRNWIMRGTVLFDPTEAYSARLKVNYTHDYYDGTTSGTQAVYCPDGTGPVAPLNLPFMAGENCKQDRYYNHPYPDPASFLGGLPNGGDFFTRTSQAFGSLEQNLKLSDNLTITSVTGLYSNWFNSLMQGSSTSAIAPYVQEYKFSNRQITQEIRLTSDYQESPVNFMVGGFYQDGKQRNLAEIFGNSRFLTPYLQFVQHQVDIKSVSVFGQVMWDITDKLELAGGARWTDEKRKHQEYNLNIANAPIGPVARPDPKISSSNISPEVSLTYKPTEDLTVFGSYKQGFKSGSFNTVNFISPTTLASFNDEKVKGFEIGLKSRFFDRTLAFNAAVYNYRYTDLQVGGLILGDQPGPGGTVNRVFIQRVLNAASARVKGAEFDFTYLPPQIEGLTLRGALNYNRARYISFPNAPCGNGQTISQGCNQLLNPATGRFVAQDLGGRPLVRAPDWAATFGASYERSVGKDMTLALATDWNYTSKYVTTLVDLPGFRQAPFYKINASIALRGREDAWEVALIGNNLTDKLTRGLCFNSNVQNGTIFGGQVNGAALPGPAGNDEAVCALDRGREVWIRVTVKPSLFFKR
jgi:iron complex outermembrane receptor protein